MVLDMELLRVATKTYLRLAENTSRSVGEVYGELAFAKNDEACESFSRLVADSIDNIASSRHERDIDEKDARIRELERELQREKARRKGR